MQKYFEIGLMKINFRKIMKIRQEAWDNFQDTGPGKNYRYFKTRCSSNK